MNPAKAVNWLNDKTQFYGLAIPGVSLKPEDILIALADVRNRGARLVGRVKYAQQMQFHNDLVWCLLNEVDALNAKYKWGLHLFEVQRLAILAVNDFLYPNHCWACRGRGTRRKNKGKDQDKAENLVISCPQCGGAGVLPRSGRSQFARAKISKWRWEQKIGYIYDREVIPILRKYEGIFFGALKNNLYGGQK